MRVRIVQQMSGYRPDGSRWPPVGEVLDLPDDEAAELCRDDPHSSGPIAVEAADAEAPAETPAPVETPEDRLAADAPETAVSETEPPHPRRGRPPRHANPK